MIISASRRTDIPAFFGKWFINRLLDGEVKVRNPFNKNQVNIVSLKPEDIDCIVFWTKNPENFIQYLTQINDLEISYYFLFTLNYYGNDYEVNLPDKNKLILTFKQLSLLLGKRKVIWRYDPIIIDNNYSNNFHLEHFEKLCKELENYTDNCITSFLFMYNKCKRNLSNYNITALNKAEQSNLLYKMNKIAIKYHIQLSICASEYNFEEIGVKPAKCIDANLIQQFTGKEIKTVKDNNQRLNCNCSKSIDIGAYNTCKHLCRYCYANYSFEKVYQNFKYINNNSPFLL